MTFRSAKYLLTIAWILLAGLLLAQEKGTKPLGKPAAPPKTGSGTVWALVVGISDYQDAVIPDLRFADRDAQEMVKFLQSAAGGTVREDQMKFLSNQQATVAQIYGALDWLLEKSAPTDRVVIYFSGHGDVETKTLRQQGFLLAYDTPPTNYRIGALRLEDLNDYLETIATENQSTVIIVTDACRSGNLAGGQEGVQTTAANLADLMQNEIKIMSCRPDELSLEGEQWGGGRGAFSYHLLEGLSGLADANDDQVISLSEIDQYLVDRVPMETEFRQEPNSIGSAATQLFKIDVPTARELRKRKQREQVTIASIDNPRAIQDFLTRGDTSLMVLYRQFETAIAGGYLLPTDWDPTHTVGKSASELYDQLLQRTELRPIHFSLRQNLVVALQDPAQQALNAYLASDPAELDERWTKAGAKYQKYPAYLAKAASLLGEGHILYRQLLAKKLYFEGLINRLNGKKLNSDSLLRTALDQEHDALSYDTSAAYICNEIGLVLDHIQKTSSPTMSADSLARLFTAQAGMYRRAMTISPRWAMPLNNLSSTFREMRLLDSAAIFAQRALEIRPDLPSAYFNLALLAELRNNLPEAIFQYQKAVQAWSGFAAAHHNLGSVFFNQNKLVEAASSYSSAIQADTNYTLAYKNLGIIYLIQRQLDSAEVVFRKLIQLVPGDFEPYYNLACVKSIQNKPTEALRWLEAACQHGLNDPNLPKSDPDLENLRKSPGFEELMKKCFPSGRN
jgi:tetratricopeptide (TPR) repeat protein